MKKSILLFSLVVTSVAHQTFGQLLHVIGDSGLLFNNDLVETFVDNNSIALELADSPKTEESLQFDFPMKKHFAFASLEKQSNTATSNGTLKIVTTAHSSAKSSNNSTVMSKAIETKELITSYSIFPNPAYADATIRFHLRQPSLVRVSVYNLLGERMKSEGIDNSSKYPAGESLVTLNTSELSSGVYLVELTADNTRLIKRLSVVK